MMPLDNYPIFGSGPHGLSSKEDLLSLTESMSSLDDHFTIDLNSGQYGYFAYPARLGFASFTDLSKSGVRWQGATWPKGEVGKITGPISIYVNNSGKLEPWYIYRTNLPNTGKFTFKVRFSKTQRQNNKSSVIRVPSQVFTDRPDVVAVGSNGDVKFSDVGQDTSVNITTTYQGISATSQVLVKSKETPLDYMIVDGPSAVNGDDSFELVVEGKYDDGSIRTIPSAKVRILSQYAFHDSDYRFVTENPPEDTTLSIEVSHIDVEGNEHRAVHNFVLKKVFTEKNIVRLVVLGPDTMQEGTENQFIARAEFSDGTNENVLAMWESSSPGLYIDQNGNATAGLPFDVFEAEVKATHQYKNIKSSASKQVTIEPNRIEPQSLQISGPDRVIELSRTQYTAFTTWSNGASTPVEAEWSVDRFSIDNQGVLNTGSVGDAVSVSIEARSGNLTGFKTVAIYDTPLELEHITVVGPEALKEGNEAQYTAFSHYSDGTDFEIEPDWSVVGNSDVDITNDGRLSFVNSSSGIVEIKAEYKEKTKIFSQTKPIVLIPEVSLIDDLKITGPSEVIEKERVQLNAMAVYENGSTEQVVPIWGVRSPDPVNNPDPPAYIVIPGVIQGRSVYEDTTVIVTARYFKEVTEYPMIVKNVERIGPDIPINSRIVGPSVVRPGFSGSYVLLATFDNGCNQEIALSNDWELNISPEKVEIDQNGFLNSRDGKSHTVEVKGIWECQGHRIEETMEVNVIAEPPQIGEVKIYGPDTVQNNSLAIYTLEIFEPGQIAEKNTGKNPSDTEWSLDTTLSQASIFNGQLFLGDLPEGQEIIIRAKVQESFDEKELTKKVTVVEQKPVFGTAPIGLSLASDVASSITNEIEPDEGIEIETTVPTGEYLYFSSPVALGEVTFTDVNSNVEAGMDGAKWMNDGSQGNQQGPLIITRVKNGIPTDWYLYRSNNSGIGTIKYRVSYSSNN